MLEIMIAAWISSHSPASCTSTMYGYKRGDTFPSNGQKITWSDPTAGGNTIWHQRHPSKVLSVAHRSLPLGTWVVIKNPRTGDTVTARVTDRGPYAYRLRNSGKIITAIKRPARDGYYTACLDISYPLGKKLKHSGRQMLQYYVISRGTELAAELDMEHGDCPPANSRAPRWWQRARNRCITRGRW